MKSLSRNDGNGRKKQRGEKTEIKPSTYRFVFLKHSVNIISPLTCLPELKHSYKVGRKCGKICKSCQGVRKRKKIFRSLLIKDPNSNSKRKTSTKASIVGNTSMIHQLWYSNNNNNNISPTKSHRRKPPCGRKKWANQCYYEVFFKKRWNGKNKQREEKSEIKPSTYRFVFLKHSVNIISPLTCLPELKHSYKVGRECGKICKSCQGVGKRKEEGLSPCSLKKVISTEGLK
ncbi:hypothetical protein CDAR_588211 [Caerostris darwini]|uniref:Uncharacterized protein n=1 Tax=Caerostris darwini TaxID=1538125 RepID=A0AAV4S7Y3_9ARAC|nr:hypothetical protein CDAR_588211 [Caerostris darwini]